MDGKNSTVNDALEMLRKLNFKKPVHMLCDQSNWYPLQDILHYISEENIRLSEKQEKTTGRNH
ncbi:hypothetical protein BCV53_09950 [Parageobacillus thermoglucosidasius]|uniref:Uncharacterized protein n=1 Tax=Parageobacillus thermoglucosidasius TaxID=1426 RepID=A0AAN0YNC0_PARTM|nr:hypothetical protein AOT13_09940 [Parageobacillus thermoglucosidasius]ANZ30395.1 hypothetical protein BCV53_09950 [Parageobacillus thermoglucosidasius]APM81133.1 hypothetical protein BCV54_09955 [Parageobacillus thermoglucosidasius]KJX68505.1 hypothetical protein WH82_11840 [Parageobacillus thermoglucosidasius]MBY6269419.1 hypothetical protein [Parageobacillus thermoglucosidasius]